MPIKDSGGKNFSAANQTKCAWGLIAISDCQGSGSAGCNDLSGSRVSGPRHILLSHPIVLTALPNAMLACPWWVFGGCSQEDAAVQTRYEPLRGDHSDLLWAGNDHRNHLSPAFPTSRRSAGSGFCRTC